MRSASRAWSVGVLALVCLLGASPGCGGGSDGDDPSATGSGGSLLGTWVGEYHHPEGTRQLTLRVASHEGTYFVGTWVSSNGPEGNVSGTVTGSQLEFVADYSSFICAGIFNGTGVLSETGGRMRMDMTWSGTDCGEPINDIPSWVERVAGP